MNRFLLVWLIVAVLLPGPTRGASPGEPITVKMGAQAESAGLKVTFGSVTEDSRCPEGANCIWAGQVTVQLDTAHGSKSESLSLTLPGKTSATTGDYTVTLQSVEPAPKAAGPKITDYVATLVVTKSAGGGASPKPK